ncbi:hypothetical protein F0562_011977 [Nyssa sinensis]|uniref:Uncharacterized protein n=1 Tax=Nyssa sinensis TaxID=561372 RepID=A0A5J4ZVZ1_9ASTE|nr:hypothetical protein F0562_011977 [Nyssa sinensis]
MIFIEDLSPYLYLEGIRGKTQIFTDSFFQKLSASMSNASCSGGAAAEVGACRNDSVALILKGVAIATILTAGVTGVAIPLVGRKRRFLRTDSNVFFAAKAFAAGVILATGFVHMLPDATSSLTDSCLPKYPWSKFPFSGFFAMMAALATLLVDFVGTQYYERKQEKERAGQIGRVESVDSLSESGIVEVKDSNGKVFGEEEGGGMHIVGMHAHAAHHRHSHQNGPEACEGHSHSHSHGFGGGDQEDGVRHVVVSQVLELGIVSHSIIIGLSLGVSQSPCTIRPLMAALSFHQFFEGFALGGCISQAQFGTLHSTLMACFFAITTPAGIAIGMGISSFYNPDSPRALIIEGIFDSISAGILVYMALVDLIAADFLSADAGGLPDRPKLLGFVGIQTGFSSGDRRAALRSTWFPSDPDGLLRLEQATGLAFRFVIGRSKDAKKMTMLEKEVEQYKDFMLIDVEEEYLKLPYKTLAFFKAAFELFEADYYVKADDDIYLRPDRLATLLAKERTNSLTYIGCMKKGPVITDPKFKWYEKSGHLIGNEYFLHAYGPIYVLSTEVVASLATARNNSLRMFSNEDVTIGSWMLAMNVHHEDNRAICDPRCTPTSIAVWDIPKCSGLCNPATRMKELHKISMCSKSPTLPPDDR